MPPGIEVDTGSGLLYDSGMTDTKRPRVGPAMREVTAYVAANPGCPKLWPALFCGPHGSTQYGCRAVDRALAAGLITDRSGPGEARYALHVTPAGTALLAQDA
jgi:hypothetical protein